MVECIDGVREGLAGQSYVSDRRLATKLVKPVPLATHTYGPEGVWVLATGFRARIAAGEPPPADDVAEIRWISLEQVDETDFAWDHDREFVRAALRDARQGEG